MSNTELGEQGKENHYYLMTVCTYSPDGSSGKFPNGFNWTKIGTQNRVEIRNPNSEVIYRGSLHIKEGGGYETMYIKLTNYNSDKSIPREVVVCELITLTDDVIKINDKTLTINSLPITTRIQIVEIPTILECHDTDFVIIDKTITEIPYRITLPDTGDYVVWVENRCIKILV